MASEFEPLENLRDRTFSRAPFLTRPISLDGRMPISEQLVRTGSGRRDTVALAYGMLEKDKRLVSNRPRVLIEDPLEHPVTGEVTFTPGCITKTVEWDAYTREINRFSLVIRPELDEDTEHFIHAIATNLGASAYDRRQAYFMLFPECRVDSTYGVRLYNGGQFIFGFTPDEEESEEYDSVMSFGETVRSQLEAGYATVSNAERRSFQLDYTICQTQANVETDGEVYPGLITLRGGLMLHRLPLYKVIRSCKRILEKKTTETDRFLNIVEPYYSVTLTAISEEDEHDNDQFIHEE